MAQDLEAVDTCRPMRAALETRPRGDHAIVNVANERWLAIRIGAGARASGKDAEGDSIAEHLAIWLAVSYYADHQIRAYGRLHVRAQADDE